MKKGYFYKKAYKGTKSLKVETVEEYYKRKRLEEERQYDDKELLGEWMGLLIEGEGT